MQHASLPPSERRLKLVSSRPPPPLGVVLRSHEPMSAVLSIGGGASSFFLGWVALAAVVEAFVVVAVLIATLWGVYAWTNAINRAIRTRLIATEEIDITRDPPPPPPPEPEEEPAPAPRHDTPPPAPVAPMRAPNVMTSDNPYDSKNTVATSPDNDIPTFGQVAGMGTGTVPTKDPTTKVGSAGTGGGTQPGPPPPPPPPPAPDRSAPARVTNQNWRCPFPPEADTAQIDNARVTVEVDVTPAGRASNVKVISEPGYGFGREARRCAMGQGFSPAKDRDGNPIAGVTRVVVRFDR